jgi:hypothetical protein
MDVESELPLSLPSFGHAFRVTDERPYDSGFLRIHPSQAGLEPGAGWKLAPRNPSNGN